MILCPKCGKVDLYKVTQYFEQSKYYSENDECVLTGKFIEYGTPTEAKCQKCGRKVKFFKDPEEVEDESKEDN